MIFGNKGGVTARIVTALLTLLVLGVVMGVFLTRRAETAKESHRVALTMVDKGVEVFFGNSQTAITADPFTVQGIDTTRYDEGWFTVSVSAKKGSDTTCILDVTVDGGSGNVTSSQTKKIHLSKGAEAVVWEITEIKG